MTNRLTPSCLVDLIHVTLACEVANSKLGYVIVAEKRVDHSLAFGAYFEAEVWS